jgi:hypothetical protein
VERKNDDHQRQNGHGQWYVTVNQQKHRCNDLKHEDHSQVIRGVQATHELSRDAPRPRQGNEVQKAVQAEDKKDHARKISRDCRYGFITGSRLLLTTN